MIEVYTDGSCKGNPGVGGWCAIMLKENGKKPFKTVKGREEKTTNNRMEMIAVIEGLRHLYENDFQREDITVYSDSNLIVQTINKGWKRKANLDLWAELDHLNEELQVDYKWVKAHDKNEWNNECDKIAQKEASRVAKSGKKLS